MSLSERVRPDVEAAPWVVEEIKELECDKLDLIEQVTALRMGWDECSRDKKELDARCDRLYQLNVDTSKEQRKERVAAEERIAELEARNKRIEDCLVHERTRVADLILTNEELKQKLAEHQAAIKNAFAMSPVYNIPRPDGTGVMVVYSVLAEQFERGHEELNNLLAKAKEEEREACASMFEGQYTDSCPQTKISAAIRNRVKR